MEQQEDNTNKKRKKLILIGLGITATGVLGYFGWNQYKKWKAKKEEENPSENPPTSLLTTTTSFLPAKPVNPSGNDDFPLKHGSKGEKVKALQEALIVKYGNAILPKYGADGSFGKEIITALKSKGLPESIDENTFNVLVKSRNFDAGALARKIYSAALGKNFNEVLSALKQMKSTDDYSAVGENFKLLRLGGVRQTLVNGLMSIFSGDQKQKIQMEFLRMGLKYDGNKWALSGITPLRKIITVRPTLVWKTKELAIKVPANIILGYELAQQNGHSVFQSIHNQQFIVKTDSIQYL